MPIYQLINTISSFTSYDHLKQVLTGGEEWHVFEVYLSSIYDLPSYEKQAIKDGLKSLKNILELESMETNTEQPRPLYELCKGKHELVKFLHLHCESDSLEIYALKDSIVSILDLKE